MAVIQTPHGRIIGLIVEDNQPKPEPVKPAAEKPVKEDEPPKRGRPKKQ